MSEPAKVVRLPVKRSPSVIRFCRKVRLARGNACENCGATPTQCKIESHHILEYHVYPDLAKDERNIIVLCQFCHGGLSRPHGDWLGERLICYAKLKSDLRERVASYVESKAPNLTGFIQIVRSGEEAAREYFFRRLEL